MRECLELWASKRECFSVLHWQQLWDVRSVALAAKKVICLFLPFFEWSSMRAAFFNELLAKASVACTWRFKKSIRLA